jgi:hypothetical protein
LLHRFLFYASQTLVFFFRRRQLGLQLGDRRLECVLFLFVVVSALQLEDRKFLGRLSSLSGLIAGAGFALATLVCYCCGWIRYLLAAGAGIVWGV